MAPGLPVFAPSKGTSWPAASKNMNSTSGLSEPTLVTGLHPGGRAFSTTKREV